MTTKTHTDLTLGSKIKKVLLNYLVTQFVLMVVVFLAAFVVLSLLKIKYALLLAIFTGAMSVVPNFGIVVSSLITGFVAAYDGIVFLPNAPTFVEGLIVAVILFLLNKLADTFLAPILLGRQSKINPVLIFVIVIMGTLLFGVVGALLAVPVVLVLKTVFDHYNINFHLKS